MTLREKYKAETGDDPTMEEELLAEDYYQQNYTIEFFTDEYVWWLESKLGEKL